MNWSEYFTYDAATGNLIWTKRPESSFGSRKGFLEWNAKYPGRIAGWTRKQSKRVSIMRRSFQVHRIIWEMHYGPVPDGLLVDHIDCNPHNNRLENLRLASKSQNGMNRAQNRNSSTGFKGVCLDRRSLRRGHKPYLATISANGRCVALGRFSTAEEAHEAYKEAAKERHGEFARFE